MRPLILKCPSCASDLAATRLRCHNCDITIEGDFALPALLRLSRAQLDFVEVFLKNRGIIREVERELGVSYPTVRARLDEVIAALGFKPETDSDSHDERGDDALTRSRRAVLDELRAGRISPEDAMRALARTKPENDREGQDNG